jgi:hypothetical protein
MILYGAWCHSVTKPRRGTWFGDTMAQALSSFSYVCLFRRHWTPVYFGYGGAATLYTRRLLGINTGPARVKSPRPGALNSVVYLVQLAWQVRSFLSPP